MIPAGIVNNDCLILVLFGLFNMINIELKTILKDSSYAIPQSITEVISNSKRVGIVYGDYDGVSLLSICSNKIIDKKITLKVDFL